MVSILLDLTSAHAASLMNAIVFNIVNLMIAAFILRRNQLATIPDEPMGIYLLTESPI